MGIKDLAKKADTKLRKMGKDWKDNAPLREEKRRKKQEAKEEAMDRKIRMEAKRTVLLELKTKQEQEKGKMYKEKEKRQKAIPDLTQIGGLSGLNSGKKSNKDRMPSMKEVWGIGK